MHLQLETASSIDEWLAKFRFASITNSSQFAATEAGTKAMFAKDRVARSRFKDRLSENVEMADMADDYFVEDPT